VKKVSEDIVAFRFNTAVSTLMICANTLQEMEKIPTEAFEMYVRLLSPFAPHVAEELWSLLGHKTSVSEASWPMFDANLAKDDIVELAIQVNGKIARHAFRLAGRDGRRCEAIRDE
jgi:leucyl-tRNA synthetase